MVNCDDSTDILDISLTDTCISSVTYTTHNPYKGKDEILDELAIRLDQEMILENKQNQLMMGRLLSVRVRPVIRQVFYHRIQWK